MLDVYGGYTWNKANVQLFAKNGTDAQAFKVTHDSQGYVTFTNVNSGKVLEVAGSRAGNNANVQQYSLDGSRAQKWVVQKYGSGYIIISALDPNFVLDLSGALVMNGRNIGLYQNNGSKAQQWNFSKHMTDRERCDLFAAQNKGKMPDGVYYIKNKNVNYALDVKWSTVYSSV